MNSYYSSGLTWEQYLQVNSFVQNINGTIKKTGAETRYAISDQTKQLVASNEALSRSFQQGFDQINGTIAEGFGVVGQKLDVLSEGIERLGAEFAWGMSLLVEQMQIQNQLLQGILERLDAIHHTLQTPTLTQAREFYRIGQERLQKGLFDKALDAFLKSEEKNDADFLTQFSLGHLYLYGYNEDCNVLDLAKAQQHFRDAARYAKAEIAQLAEARRYCGEAYLHASIACYAQAEEKRLSGDARASEQCLREAVKFAQQANEVYPELAEAFFQNAKICALIGDADTAIQKLALAIQADRKYCLKADHDHDFDRIRPNIINLFERFREQAGEKSKAAPEKIRQLLEEYVFYTYHAQQVKMEIEALIEKTKQANQGGNYFDYLDAIAWSDQAQNLFQSLLMPRRLVNVVSHTSSVASVAFSPDGCYLASGCDLVPGTEDKTVQLWEFSSKKTIATLQSNSLVAFNPDGHYLASRGYYDSILLWEISSRQCIGTFQSHEGSVDSVIFSPNMPLFASSAGGGTVRLWDVSSRQCVAILQGHTSPVFSVAFSPDGRYLASGSGDDTIRLWDVSSRQCVAILQGHAGSINSVTFSPDGCYLASGSPDSIVRLWDVSSRQCVAILQGHTSPVFSVAFGPDGRYLASGSGDNTVRLWDVSSRQCVATLQGHTARVRSVAFSPNSHYLASGGEDRIVRLWGPEIVSVQQQRTEEEQHKREQQEKQVEQQKQAAEQQKQEQLRRAERRQQGQCEKCGVALGFFARLTGTTLCKSCR